MSAIPMPIAAAPAGRRTRRSLRWCARYIEEKLFKTTLPPEEVAAIFVEPSRAKADTSWPRQSSCRSCAASATGTASCWCGRSAAARPHRQVVGGRTRRRGAGHGLHRQGHRLRDAARRLHDRAEIMDWVPGSHASTFGGNPVASPRPWPPWTSSSANNCCENLERSRRSHAAAHVRLGQASTRS